MQTIKEILTYPNGTPIEAVQAKIDKVYDYKQMTGDYGPYTVQAIVLMDATGESIRCSIFDHPDLNGHEAKEYVFSSGKGGKDIVVKHGSYTPKAGGEKKNTIELKIGKKAQLMHIAVYNDQSGNKAIPSPSSAQAGSAPSRSNGTAPMGLNGAKVGMAINNAVLILTSSGEQATLEAITRHAVNIIRLSNDLESGKIVIDAPVVAVKPEPASQPPAKTEEDKDEVPY